MWEIIVQSKGRCGSIGQVWERAEEGVGWGADTRTGQLGWFRNILERRTTGRSTN